MEPAPWMRFHPFVATLEQWTSGIEALCGEPWSEAAIRAAIGRGPHTSALTPEARDLIDKKMKYQIQAGFSEMVRWRTIQHADPTNLKVSPLAVIPQVGRRGRLLLDLSFPSQAARPASKHRRRNWVVPPPLAPSVYSTTIQQSPDYPVKELEFLISLCRTTLEIMSTWFCPRGTLQYRGSNSSKTPVVVGTHNF
jgi:hypothetical protein